MKKSFTIHDLPRVERPRERLLAFGVNALSQQELIEILLGRGIRGESVMVTAQRLISEFGNLKKIEDASIEELKKIKGIGTAKACQLKAAFEISKRIGVEYEINKKCNISLKTPEDVAKIAWSKLKDKKKEHFLVLLLSSRNHLILITEVSIGSLNANIVHPREVFKEAIKASAASVIFVHNHPSGDPEPSDEDIQLTKRLIEAGKLLGIDVLDHIILGDKVFLSMKGKKLM